MARRKVTMQVRELSELDVTKISLVKRGANRIPFRITKSTGDTDMLDLGTIFLKKKEVLTPMVVGVALAKGDHTKLYTEALANQDLAVVSVAKNDGEDTTILMLAKGELKDMGDVVAMKINDEAAILVAGVQKGLLTYPDTQDFDENISKAGFFPSYRMAIDILSDTISNIAYSEGDVDVTKTAIQKALGDFTGFVEGALSTVPVSAFKAEEAIVATQKGMLINEGHTGDKENDTGEADADKEADTTNADKDADKDNADADNADADKDKDAEANNADAEADKDAGSDTANTETDTTAADNKDDVDVNKKDSDNGDVMAALSKITTSISGLATDVHAVKDELGVVKGEFNGQVKTLKASLKKTDEALAGTIHSDVSDDDSSTTTTQKSDDDGDVSWDSALDFGEGVERA